MEPSIVTIREPGVQEIPGTLLCYFRTWYNAIQDMGIEIEGSANYKVTQFMGILSDDLWYWLLLVFSRHAKEHGNLTIEERITVPITEWFGFDDFKLHDYYALMVFIDRYDVILPSKPKDNRIFKGILSLLGSLWSMEALMGAHPEMKGVYVSFEPTTHEEQIAFQYASWRDAVRQILMFHTQNYTLSAMFIDDYLPPIGPLVARKGENSYVVTKDGIVRTTDPGLSSKWFDYDVNTRIQGYVCGITISSSHGAIITNNGLFMFGSNTRGQLGMGKTKNDISPPSRIMTLDRCVRSVSCESFTNTTMIVTNDGLYMCGDNVLTPEKLAILDEKDVHRVVQSPRNTIIETSDGTLYSYGGDNTLGQQGHVNMNASLGVREIELPMGMGRIRQILLEGNVTFILTMSGEIYVSGIIVQLTIRHTLLANIRDKTTTFVRVPIDNIPGIRHIALLESMILYAATKSNLYQINANGPLLVDRLPQIVDTIITISNGGEFGKGSLYVTTDKGLFVIGDTRKLIVPIEKTRLTIELGVGPLRKKKETSERDDSDDRGEKRVRYSGCVRCGEMRLSGVEPFTRRFAFCATHCYEKFFNHCVLGATTIKITPSSLDSL